MPARDWRDKATRADDLRQGEYYRSPLWKDDHLLGRKPELLEEGVAWCGRPLRLAMDGWGDEQLEGLWHTNRRSAACSTCKRMDQEWIEQQEIVAGKRKW